MLPMCPPWNDIPQFWLGYLQYTAGLSSAILILPYCFRKNRMAKGSSFISIVVQRGIFNKVSSTSQHSKIWVDLMYPYLVKNIKKCKLHCRVEVSKSCTSDKITILENQSGPMTHWTQVIIISHRQNIKLNNN